MAKQKAADASPQVGIKKRQQISSTNRAMFLWVAGASVITAFALVGIIFLVQKGIFNEKVLMKKGDTASTLSKDIDNAKTLNKAVNELRSDRSIGKVPSSVSGSNNLDKVLDALPYEGDAVALGSSLQTALLNGITIDSLSIDTGNDPNSSASAALASEAPVGDAQPIGFSFKATGDDASLKALFEKLDRSLRPIKIVSLQLQAAGVDKISATVQAVTYYQPLKTFELTKEVVKP